VYLEETTENGQGSSGGEARVVRLVQGPGAILKFASILSSELSNLKGTLNGI